MFAYKIYSIIINTYVIYNSFLSNTILVYAYNFKTPMTRQEDRIKNYLQLLGEHEDLRSTSYDFKNNFNSVPMQQTFRDFGAFTDITDWQDNRGSSYYAASLPKLSKSK